MTEKLLEDSIIRRFERDGYVVIPDLLTEDEITRYQLAVRQAVAHRARKDQRPLSAKSAYEQSFRQCMNLWEDFPDVRPLTFHPLLAQAAAELIGATRVRLWHDQALFKEPGGRSTDTHQDLPYWAMAESDALTAWIPFDGSTLASGCMGFIPGTHRLGIRQLVNIFRAGEEDLDAQAADMMVADPVYVEVPRGSVSFHHGLTAHCAMPNRTATNREVHTMIFFRDGMTRHAENRHYAVDRAGVAPGEIIASDVTPIAWPRDGLPDTPPPMDLPQKMKDSGAFPVID